PPSYYMDTPPTNISNHSLHDALPILIIHGNAAGSHRDEVREHQAGERIERRDFDFDDARAGRQAGRVKVPGDAEAAADDFPCVEDRKSTRLNSSHVKISYAVFCLKNK